MYANKLLVQLDVKRFMHCVDSPPDDQRTSTYIVYELNSKWGMKLIVVACYYFI